MTVLRSSNASVWTDRGKPIGTNSGVSPWQRPADWLTYTMPLATEQKVVGTIAVFNQSANYLALQVTITDGTQYTVDWGDGTTSDHNSGTLAEKNYTWSSISSGTLTSQGYRQAIVTITPKIAGRTFSNLQLSRKPSALSANTNSSSPWLSIAVAAPNASVDFYSNSGLDVTNRQVCTMVEDIQLIAFNQSNTAALFRNMYNLQNVTLNNLSNTFSTEFMFANCRSLKIAPFFNTGSVNITSSMFVSCTSLEVVPFYNLASNPDWRAMFSGCSSLKQVPPFNTSAATTMFQMFSGSGVETIPLFNTANVNNMSNMFQNCTSLKTVPLLNTAAVTSMGQMFSGCTALEYVPPFNISSLTNMANMFNTCNSLVKIPDFNSSLITTMQTMLQSCFTLKEIDINLSGIVSNTTNNLGLGNSTLNNASGTLSRAKITGNKWSQTFQNCRMEATELDEMYTSLATLNPAITNISGSGTVVTVTVGTANISPFVATRSVTISGVDPVAYNITGTIASVNTGAGTFTINNAATGTYVSGGIASITSDRTITVTGNPGVATDNPTIATNKGWTVTG